MLNNSLITHAKLLLELDEKATSGLWAEKDTRGWAHPYVAVEANGKDVIRLHAKPPPGVQLDQGQESVVEENFDSRVAANKRLRELPRSAKGQRWTRERTIEKSRLRDSFPRGVR